LTADENYVVGMELKKEVFGRANAPD